MMLCDGDKQTNIGRHFLEMSFSISFLSVSTWQDQDSSTQLPTLVC